MGQSRESRQSNQMLSGIQREAQGFGQGFSNTFMDRGTQGYNRFSGVQDEVLNNYRNMLSGVGGGGGGGIPGMNEYIAKMEGVGKLGAFSPEQAEALRGWGVPKEFAETGGFSDADRRNFRARATATIPGFFGGMARNLRQRQAITGGYGPGFDSGSTALMRERARAGSEASLGAETNLANMIREGRKWGSSTGANLENTLFQNMMTGVNQAQSGRSQLAASRRAARSAGFGQQMALNSAMLGAAGATGPDLAYGNLALQGFGTGLQGQLGAASQYSARNPNRDWLDRVSQIGGAAAGVVPAFRGGS